VFAPPAVKTELAPEHIVDGDADAVTVGVGFTVTVTDFVPVQPSALVPVTVYVVVLVGDTVLELPVPRLFDQLYVLAPPAVNVDDEPEHIVDGDAEAVTVGVGLTVTVTDFVPVHPSALVPVTVYVVVVVGDTVLLAPLPRLCDQLYVLAPPAVNMDDEPEHIVDGDAEAVTVGVGFTVTVTVFVPVHPSALVPVTVYVVVVVGVTVLLAPLPRLCDQLYVLAPPAVNVDDEPEHIVDDDAEAVTVGVGFTVTVTDFVPVQPAVLVPVTAYVVVEVGDTVLELPVPNPPDQLYVLAPPAVKTELAPEHIVDGDADAVTVGVGLTVTFTVTDLVTPLDPVPVTVYVVVVVGVTVLLAPLPRLCDQL